MPLLGKDNRTLPSFPASIKELLQEEHSGKSHDEAKALGKSHEPAENIYKICYSSTVKRSGATVEDVTPGIHMVANTATRTGDGSGRLLQTGYTWTTCCTRHHEASTGIGIESNLWRTSPRVSTRRPNTATRTEGRLGQLLQTGYTRI